MDPFLSMTSTAPEWFPSILRILVLQLPEDETKHKWPKVDFDFDQTRSRKFVLLTNRASKRGVNGNVSGMDF